MAKIELHYNDKDGKEQMKGYDNMTCEEALASFHKELDTEDFKPRIHEFRVENTPR